MTSSGVLVIGNHTLLFLKVIKIQKKKLSNFFKKKILLGNSYAKITKKYFSWKFSKKVMISYSNWPKTNLLTRAHQKWPYFSETIFYGVFWDMSLILPKAPRKKFILCSGFDKICIKNTIKSLFSCLKTPQFWLYCFSDIL